MKSGRLCLRIARIEGFGLENVCFSIILLIFIEIMRKSGFFMRVSLLISR